MGIKGACTAGRAVYGVPSPEAGARLGGLEGATPVDARILVIGPVPSSTRARLSILLAAWLAVSLVAVTVLGPASVRGLAAPDEVAPAPAAHADALSPADWTQLSELLESIDPTLSQQAYVKASNTGASDFFGESAAVSDNTVVIGARLEDSNATGVNGNQANNDATDSGAAYVFKRSGGTWSQQAYLKASNSEAFDYFGYSVAISGDTIVVGAPYEGSNAIGIGGDQANNEAVNSGAAYVFTRSAGTWSQQAYLKASNTGASDFFGGSVAISGDTIVVGAKLEDTDAPALLVDSGAAYVFTRSAGTWSQQAYLKASNADASDFFGDSVAISGDTIVVGAFGEDSSATGIDGDGANNDAFHSGAAYVFTRSGANWTEQAYLKASNSGVEDYFSYAVAISGDTIVVGAEGEKSNATGVNGDQADNSATFSGAAYVFTRSAGIWSQQAYLKASNTGAFDSFGHSVTISGDTVIVGAHGEASNATGVNGDGGNNSVSGSGAAYVFRRSAGIWSQQAYLKASNPDASDWFGTSVAVSGYTIVVGATGEASNALGVNGDPTNSDAKDAGAAYVFYDSACIEPPFSDVAVDHPFCAEIKWMREEGISTGFTDGTYRPSIAVTRQAMSAFMARLVGAALVPCVEPPFSDVPISHPFCEEIQWMRDEGISTGFNDGTYRPSIAVTRQAMSAFMQRLSGQPLPPLAQHAYAKASNTGAGDAFGISVALSGDTLVIGAPYEDSTEDTVADSGAVYVFTRVNGAWSQQALLRASNAEAIDWFGWSVAIDGDTIVIGAPNEDSATTLVNGDAANNTAFDAGAAYVFTRSAGTWSQQAYLKASNTGAGDHFGHSVAISGETIVVGAPAEDSNATGVDGSGTEIAPDAGAAYVFVRQAEAWAPQAYLKASNTGLLDAFGTAVAISGDTIAVGAPQEDGSGTGINAASNDLAPEAGAAYLFARSSGSWSPLAYVKASNSGALDTFGQSVALSDGTLVIGAPQEDGFSGAVYVFADDGGWSERSYLKAEHPDPVDKFGTSVAVSGNALVVGALEEDGGSTGLVGDPLDNSASNAGAAYWFVRQGTSWTQLQQEAYVKASNTGAGDMFGHAVAISGETIVVGAPKEDSSATGIGDPGFDSASDAGAAYIFGPPCVTPPFSDVPTSHPFCAEIKWMKDNDVSTGFNDGTYRPSISVTRQAMSAFMQRVAPLLP
jgi:hypothetical protein